MINTNDLEEIIGFKIEDKIYTQSKSDVRKLLYAIGWTDEDIEYAELFTEADLWENISKESYNYAVQMYENGISTFDFSNDTDLQILPHFSTVYNNVSFKNCSNLKYIPIYTITPEEMKECFYGCTQLKSCYLGKWDVYSIEDFSKCFYNCKGGLHLDGISDWNTINASDFSSMFEGGIFNNDIDLKNWNTSKVTNFAAMFKNCKMNSLSVKNFDFDGDKKWNQIALHGKFDGDITNFTAGNSSLTINNGILTIKKGGLALGGFCKFNNITGNISISHKYYMSAYVKVNGTGSRSGIGFLTSLYTIGGNDSYTTDSTEFVFLKGITSPVNNTNVFCCKNGTASTPVTTTADFKEVLFIDLTNIFGAGNEPLTFEDFKQWCDDNGYDLYKYNRYYDPTYAGADDVSEMFFNANINTLNTDNCKFNSDIIADTSMFNGSSNGIAELTLYGKSDIVPNFTNNAVWNLIVLNGGNFLNTDNITSNFGTISANDNKLVFTSGASGTSNLLFGGSNSYTEQHKYYISTKFICDYTASSTNFVNIGLSGNYIKCNYIVDEYDTYSAIWIALSNQGPRIYPRFSRTADTENITIDYFNITDLTEMFGAGKEPATTEEFETWMTTNGITINTHHLCTNGTYQTPDAPWAIKCNNGLLTFKQKNILPEGYIQLDYISNTGNAFIDTGYRGACKLYIDASLNSMSLSGVLFGTSATIGSYLATLGSDNKWAIGQTSTTYSSTTRTKIYVDFAETGSTLRISAYKDGPTTAPYLENNWSIFKNNGGTAMPATGKLYALKMKNLDGTLVRDYIPCKNNSDVVGLYDLVNNLFVTTQSGSFVAGDISDNYELIGDNIETITDANNEKAYTANLLNLSTFIDEQNITNGKINRKIKSIIFNGTESWTTGSVGSYIQRCAITLNDLNVDEDYDIVCTHFKKIPNTTLSSSNLYPGAMYVRSSVKQVLFGSFGIVSNAALWKNWLKEQYNNGTPVTIYYITTDEITEYVAPLTNITKSPIDVSGGYADLDYEIINSNDGINTASCKSWTLDGSIFNLNTIPSQFVRQMTNGTNVTDINMSNMNFITDSSTLNLEYFLSDCPKLEAVNINNMSMDVSTLNMNGLFRSDNALDDAHITNNWPNNIIVTNMFNVEKPGSLENIDITDSIYVNDITGLFRGQNNLTDCFEPIHINNCSAFTDAFADCDSLLWILLVGWHEGTIDFGDSPNLEPETIEYLLLNMDRTTRLTDRILTLHNYDVYVNFIEKYPSAEDDISYYNITITIKN